MLQALSSCKRKHVYMQFKMHLPLLMLQDRITSDGRLITDPQNRADTDSAQASVDPAAIGLKRFAGVPATAPVTDPISNKQLAELVDFVTGCKQLLVLTGAGCSTESNIPDYRGPKGAYSTGFQPMTHQQVTLFHRLFETLRLIIADLDKSSKAVEQPSRSG